MVKIERIFIVLLFTAACYMNVPHDSLKDAQNPFGQGAVSIKVCRKDGMPIRNALVKINGEERGLTGADGTVYADMIQNGALNIECLNSQYEPYEKDTVLSTGEELSIKVYLDYIPFFSSSRVYSSVEKVTGFIDTLRYSVYYYASVKDIDGREDIQSAMLNLPDSSIEMTFDSASDSEMFYSVCLTDTSYSNIFDLQGFAAEAYVVDRTSFADTSSEMILIRFVESIPEIISPTEGGSIIPPDTVIWNAPSGIYQSYISLIILNDGTEVFREDSIEVANSSYIISEALQPDEYRLLCRMYDVFGNYSQNEVNFIVP